MINKLFIFITEYCLYVADPATFLASNNLLGTQLSSVNSLFSQLQKKEVHLSLYYYRIDIVNIKILSLSFFSEKLRCAPLNSPDRLFGGSLSDVSESKILY